MVEWRYSRSQHDTEYETFSVSYLSGSAKKSKELYIDILASKEDFELIE